MYFLNVIFIKIDSVEVESVYHLHELFQEETILTKHIQVTHLFALRHHDKESSNFFGLELEGRAVYIGTAGEVSLFDYQLALEFFEKT